MPFFSRDSTYHHPLACFKQLLTTTIPNISLYLLFNERYWAPVFASQVLTEEPGLTWVAFTLNSSIHYDTPNISAVGSSTNWTDCLLFLYTCISGFSHLVAEHSTPTTRRPRQHELASRGRRVTNLYTCTRSITTRAHLVK